MLKLSALLVYWLASIFFHQNWFGAILSAPMLGIVFIGLAQDKERYIGVIGTIWFFVYLFFVIGPVQAIEYPYFTYPSPVGLTSFTTSEFWQGMALPLIFFSFVLLLQCLTPKASQRKIEIFYPDGVCVVLMTLTVMTFCVYVQISGGLTNLLASRFDKNFDEISQFSGPVFGALIALVLALCVAAREEATPLRITTFGIGALCMILAANPFNTARYFLLAAYLPMFLILIRGKITSSVFFMTTLLGSAFVFPILSVTTRFSGFSADFGDLSITNMFFRISNIDVFDMTVYEIRYFTSESYYFGLKSLGLILFFIPRALWPAKPELTALQMGEGLLNAKGAGTSNLSLFVGGDFYADGGMIGVALGGLLFAFALRYYYISRSNLPYGQDLSRYMIIGSLPILIRGPLGANAPVAFASLVVLALVQLMAARVRYGYRDPSIQMHTAAR